MLEVLVDEGFLITGLRPPMTADDPLRYLIGALRSAGAGQLPAAAPVLHELERISAQLRAHNGSADPAQAAKIRANVTARMTMLRPARRYPLTVGMRLDWEISLPGTVLDEAAVAADGHDRVRSRTSRRIGIPINSV